MRTQEAGAAESEGANNGTAGRCSRKSVRGLRDGARVYVVCVSVDVDVGDLDEDTAPDVVKQLQSYVS